LPARLPAVLVTIHPADGSMAPAERPKHLYARFLSAAATPEDGGLIRRRFRPGTPFEGEDLVLSAPDGRAFAARCLDASSEVATACVAEMRLGALDVQARFAPALLPRWEALTARLNGLVARSGG
jgi:hypothetical protein